MSLKDHSVPGSAAAFSYQFERAMHWLAQSQSGCRIGIETCDDVSASHIDGSQILEQDKHSIRADGFQWRVHAYVVMSNHFHLAVELTEPNLSEGMKWLQGTWIRRYNGMRRLIGRPFQGRYKALLVEPGHALGQVCHYIHLNPVRAGLVRGNEAATHAWSSLPKFSGKARPEWLGVSSQGVCRAKGSGRYIDTLQVLVVRKVPPMKQRHTSCQRRPL